MAQRDEDLLRVREIVAEGGQVDIVGPALSGRTYLLDQLCADLLNEDWNVTRVDGAHALRGVPLAAAMASGLAGDPVGSTLAAASAACLAELTKRSVRKRHLIAVDDWEFVDQATQGIIHQACRSSLTSLALTRHSASMSGQAGDPAHGSPAPSTLQVPLHPLRYEDLQDILRSRLGGDLAASTMSRIYARSDGSIGLSIATLEAGIRDARLIRVDGVWTSAGEVWSPMLGPTIGRFLAPLSPVDREAMELLSLTGVVDLETAVDIVGEASIDALEERALVRLHPSAGGYLVAVSPSMLAEHIRRTQPVARRVRLRAVIERRLAGADAPFLPPGDESTFIASPAGFVSIIREQLHTRLLVTRAAWQHRASADTAVPYVEALIADNASADRIEGVLELAIEAPGSVEHAARLRVLAAQHRAYARGELDGALADLREVESAVGEFAPLLRAWGVEIETVMRGVPADAMARLTPGPDELLDEPASVAAARHWVAALIATAMGRFSESGEHLECARRERGGELDDRGLMLSALNLLGLGQLERAIELALGAIEESRAAFDVEALRRHSYVAALCYMLQGNYAGIEAIAEEVFGLGDPPEAPQVAQLAILAISTTVAHRQGKAKLARRYEAQLARLAIQDGPLPGMVRPLSEIQALAATRQPVHAADLAQTIADGHWERGYRFHAAFGYCLAVEFDPTPARYAAASERLGAFDGDYFATQRIYLKALVDNDPSALSASVDRLLATGRVGQAIGALTRAAELLASADRDQESAIAQERARALIAATPTGSYDIDRYGGRAVRLTPREREIVGLVARGLTNSEIADRLTVSPRTVESHMNHIIAKSGVTVRDEFKGLATRLGDY